MTNSEQYLINAIASGLLGQPVNPGYRATGIYGDRSRVIELEGGDLDYGPVIGGGGSMKIAIQSLLACPFGGDACQIRIRSTRERRIPDQANQPPDKGPFELLMHGLQNHMHPSAVEYSIETSESTVVVLVKTKAILAEEMRGPLNKVVRGIGKAHGFQALVSVEKLPEPAHA